MHPPRLAHIPHSRWFRIWFPRLTIATIFDVGANVGQSTLRFRASFPDATIFAFEPAEAGYNKLARTVESLPRVRTFRLALGREVSRAHLRAKGASPANRIVESPSLFERSRLDPVTIVAGDAFAAEHGIDRIGFLKIDTEGHDLDVLVGFQRMLSEMRIDILQAEVGMNPENTRHAPLEAVKAYLESLGYRVVHLYEQVLDVAFSGRPVLRRVNAIFASAATIDANRSLTGRASRVSD
jgi:FkbM family methyltransferase